MNSDEIIRGTNHETKNSNDYSEYKQMKLGKVKNGTVIDHIPPELCFRLIKILNLEGYGHVLSSATNLISAKLGKKGMIKISGKFLTEEEVNKVAVVAPNVTMCTVTDYNVSNKIKLSLPREIKKIVNCNNPNCITNVEEVSTHFYVVQESPLNIKCHYCERTIDKEEITLI
ncbi:aspartate carbamoyltransferase regulatory subunit [Candidatus Woesearchaeota archaeon]|jgi:aspartate carbamoyltransferase regulatory subunit|nr:aspartate carbamoyltransferase regulatory subunit [Candidatus Woesearchaeota archaeon]MBT5271895.1 aspartate carbamoyltransferase regulatory subunit [Candidatus Woesearchaeota archaeon]MBT6040698.1 aspartate carbamoyltransferase regulatory subunit [Candidatus Woesearchaeota archaeon]MBT6336183.1 aspartate carbamoyltransferase regulatory subunit [Candidatus Woesearchaeota archaeon]MBT7928050.1 aspartate carbamoyltransferase regulatory subunit [Candidatus Woesearchaeota archaeon]